MPPQHIPSPSRGSSTENRASASQEHRSGGGGGVSHRHSFVIDEESSRPSEESFKVHESEIADFDYVAPDFDEAYHRHAQGQRQSIEDAEDEEFARKISAGRGSYLHRDDFDPNEDEEEEDSVANEAVLREEERFREMFIDSAVGSAGKSNDEDEEGTASTTSSRDGSSDSANGGASAASSAVEPQTPTPRYATTHHVVVKDAISKRPGSGKSLNSNTSGLTTSDETVSSSSLDMSVTRLNVRKTPLEADDDDGEERGSVDLDSARDDRFISSNYDETDGDDDGSPGTEHLDDYMLSHRRFTRGSSVSARSSTDMLNTASSSSEPSVSGLDEEANERRSSVRILSSPTPPPPKTFSQTQRHSQHAQQTRQRASIRQSNSRYSATHGSAGRESSRLSSRRRMSMRSSFTVSDDILAMLGPGANVNATNSAGRSLLHVAAQQNNTEGVRILLELGAKVNVVDADERTPLHLTTSPDVAELLLSKLASPNATDLEGLTPLHHAVQNGDAALVKRLLKYYPDMDAQEIRFGRTPLHLAVYAGHLQISELLVDHIDTEEGKSSNKGEKKSEREIERENSNSAVNASDFIGNTALHYAVSRPVAEKPHKLAAVLLSHGASPHNVNNKGQTPLHVHVMLCSEGGGAMAAPSPGPAHSPSPLTSAASSVGLEVTRVIISMLLQKGASIDAVDEEGSTALHLAIRFKKYQVAKLLVRYGANLNAVERKQSLMASEMLPTKLLRQFLAAGLRKMPSWVSDQDRQACMNCKVNFGVFRRRHHCRHCCRLCCNDCTQNSVKLSTFPVSLRNSSLELRKMPLSTNMKVCNLCYKVINEDLPAAALGGSAGSNGGDSARVQFDMLFGDNGGGSKNTNFINTVLGCEFEDTNVTHRRPTRHTGVSHIQPGAKSKGRMKTDINDPFFEKGTKNLQQTQSQQPKKSPRPGLNARTNSSSQLPGPASAPHGGTGIGRSFSGILSSFRSGAAGANAGTGGSAFTSLSRTLGNASADTRNKRTGSVSSFVAPVTPGANSTAGGFSSSSFHRPMDSSFGGHSHKGGVSSSTSLRHQTSNHHTQHSARYHQQQTLMMGRVTELPEDIEGSFVSVG